MTEIMESQFKVIVKPNSAKNEILSYDSERKAYIIRIKAPATKGKANRELIKFLSRELKKKVLISSGLSSHCKIIVLGDLS